MGELWHHRHLGMQTEGAAIARARQSSSGKSHPSNEMPWPRGRQTAAREPHAALWPLECGSSTKYHVRARTYSAIETSWPMHRSQYFVEEPHSRGERATCGSRAMVCRAAVCRPLLWPRTDRQHVRSQLVRTSHMASANDYAQEIQSYTKYLEGRDLEYLRNNILTTPICILLMTTSNGLFLCTL
uniref:Uncharacterized protein n=1 Tax=Myotis myotis TaxID=51298 RepID=A0A7J7V3I3_MYOMY|nr:hypothetical protein mMyoMyo1_008464 [Myotis myotis]